MFRPMKKESLNLKGKLWIVGENFCQNGFVFIKFVTKLRLYLNIPINQLFTKEKCICSNSPQLTLRHAVNCSKLITHRSSLHDAVRDTVFNMAQTARISCIKEHLLKETLFLNNFGSDDRGDVYCYWIDNSEAIVDFVSCNVANDTLVHRRKLNPVAPLDFKAKERHRKYDKDIEEANVDRNTQLVFIAFPFSMNGRLSDEAETFLNDFQKMVQEKTMKRFDIFYGVHGFNLPLLIDYHGFSIE
ncbi:hypothetical protein P9112_006488 [Eukaryota sp. TZLM1-RC]